MNGMFALKHGLNKQKGEGSFIKSIIEALTEEITGDSCSGVHEH